jgi:hypothetical protein
MFPIYYSAIGDLVINTLLKLKSSGRTAHLKPNSQFMQEKAGEVTLSVTSHNQKQQQKQSNHKTQTAANRPQEVVCTEPKTTTKRKPQRYRPTPQPTQKPIEETKTHFSIGYLRNATRRKH